MRRSGRLFKSDPILLIGSDAAGRMFSEESHTVVLSLHGAGIVSNHKLLAEQELILRSMETNREAEIRVVREIGSEDGHFTYGVAFLDDDLDFWELDFPPPSPVERPLELVQACGSCGETVTLLNGDYEFDVCAIHGGLVRYCTECGFATVWRRSEAGEVPRAVAPKVGRKLEPPQRETVVVEHPGLDLEDEREIVAHPFAGYMEPRVTVNLEPREEQMEEYVEERGSAGNQRSETDDGGNDSDDRGDANFYDDGGGRAATESAGEGELSRLRAERGVRERCRELH